jgi:hypothetical protein
MREQSIDAIRSGFDLAEWVSVAALHFTAQVASGSLLAGEQSVKFVDG